MYIFLAVPIEREREKLECPTEPFTVSEPRKSWTHVSDLNRNFGPEIAKSPVGSGFQEQLHPWDYPHTLAAVEKEDDLEEEEQEGKEVEEDLRALF